MLFRHKKPLPTIPENDDSTSETPNNNEASSSGWKPLETNPMERTTTSSLESKFLKNNLEKTKQLKNDATNTKIKNDTVFR